MKVYISYAPPEKASVLKLAVRAWEARGFTVRFLLPGMAVPKTGLRVNPRLINFAWGPRSPKSGFRRAVKRFPSLKSPLVQFPPGVTEDQILNCGRDIL